jgi:hypothetical protein
MLRSCLILFISTAFIGLLQLWVRIYHPEDVQQGLYLQAWTSDQMMQTLPVQQLRAAPLESVWYLHIQPPLLDTIRALLAVAAPSDAPVQLQRFVDLGMYIVWALFYGALSLIVFNWLHAATRSTRIASFAWLLWLMYPGAIGLSTLLEGTLLSSLLTTWLLYELWLFSTQRGSQVRVSCAAILLFLTRTVFQWPFLIVLTFALMLSGATRAAICKIMLPVLIVVCAFLAKQHYLFATFSTTSFAGQHKLGILQYTPTEQEVLQALSALTYRYPEAAKAYSSKYNNEQQVRINLVQSEIASQRLRCCLYQSLEGILASIEINAQQMLLPVSRYTDFVLVKYLPWRAIYEHFSVLPFLVLIVVAALVWVLRLTAKETQFRGSAPAVIAGYTLMVLLLSNRYSWTEAERLKFLLEPAAFVFVITQCTHLLRRLKR